MKKIVKIILSILIFAIIFGLLGLFTGIMYGGNYGCFFIIDSIFAPLRGYESCGLFGLGFGIILGTILSYLFLKKKFY